jgi:hypothetical protein
LKGTIPSTEEISVTTEHGHEKANRGLFLVPFQEKGPHAAMQYGHRKAMYAHCPAARVIKF